MASKNFATIIGRDAIGRTLTNCQTSRVSGGDINSAFLVVSDEGKWFVKLNDKSLLSMFEAEATALHELKANSEIHIPDVVSFGVAGQDAYLVLEYIELRSSNSSSDKLLGEQLAQLHLHSAERRTSQKFGWQINNTIGSTQQINNLETNWVEFWQQHRLGYQLQLLTNKGVGSRLIKSAEKLINNLDDFFIGYSPIPSLLHGDLWGGNKAADFHGRPVIFDPASYYGDREADIAMTELFGGFSQEFYQAYNYHFKLDSGYKSRKKLYNLYHVLNHANLFSGSYISMAQSYIDDLL